MPRIFHVYSWFQLVTFLSIFLPRIFESRDFLVFDSKTNVHDGAAPLGTNSEATDQGVQNGTSLQKSKQKPETPAMNKAKDTKEIPTNIPPKGWLRGIPGQEQLVQASLRLSRQP